MKFIKLYNFIYGKASVTMGYRHMFVTVRPSAKLLLGKEKRMNKAENKGERDALQTGHKAEAAKLYGWLFGVNFFISAFTFGGGYVVIPMIRRFYVQKKKYLTEDELGDLAALAQSSPGAIAINLAALAGYRSGKAKGAFISCVGALLPPLLLFAVISVCYEAFAANRAVSAVLKGMEAGVAALIADLVIDMFRSIKKESSAFFTWMAPLVFVLEFFLKVPVAFLLAACIAACLVYVRLGYAKGWQTQS